MTILVSMAVGTVLGFVLDAIWHRRCLKGQQHDWQPEGFADWKCSKCGRLR